MDLHVEQHGEGPPMILAHGFGGSARNFRPQVRALRSQWRIHLYDAPGHARSGPPASMGLAALVAAFGAVVEDAGPGPVVAGGLSLGAATALHYALDRPDRVRALILASPPAGRGAGGVFAAGAGAFAEAIDRDGLEAAGARYVWGEDSGLDEAGRRWVRQGFLEHAPEAIAGLLRGALAELPSPDELAPRLARLDCPVLLIAGERDTASVGAARSLAAAVPHARLALVPDAGHVVNLQRPEAFHAALEAFLAGLPAL